MVRVRCEILDPRVIQKKYFSSVAACSHHFLVLTLVDRRVFPYDPYGTRLYYGLLNANDIPSDGHQRWVHVTGAPRVCCTGVRQGGKWAQPFEADSTGTAQPVNAFHDLFSDRRITYKRMNG